MKSSYDCLIVGAGFAVMFTTRTSGSENPLGHYVSINGSTTYTSNLFYTSFQSMTRVYAHGDAPPAATSGI